MLRRFAWLAAPILLLACSLSGTGTTPVEPTTAAPASTETPAAPTLPPLPSETPAPAGPTAIPGWLTYHNAMIGYSFDYPPEAALELTGVDGYPTEELPAGLGPGDYFATLEATYTEALCAAVELPAGSFILWSPQEEGGRYAGPCGVSGIGVYDQRKEEMPITIDGQALVLGTTRLYEVGTETLVNEFSSVRLADGTLLSLVSAWEQNGLTYEEYLADRAVLLRVITSYRSDP